MEDWRRNLFFMDMYVYVYERGGGGEGLKFLEYVFLLLDIARWHLNRFFIPKSHFQCPL